MNFARGILFCPPLCVCSLLCISEAAMEENRHRQGPHRSVRKAASYQCQSLYACAYLFLHIDIIEIRKNHLSAGDTDFFGKLGELKRGRVDYSSVFSLLNSFCFHNPIFFSAQGTTTSFYFLTNKEFCLFFAFDL